MHINGTPLGKKCFYGNRFVSKPLVWMFFTSYNDVFNLVSVQFTNNSYYIPKSPTRNRLKHASIAAHTCTHDDIRPA